MMSTIIAVNYPTLINYMRQMTLRHTIIYHCMWLAWLQTQEHWLITLTHYRCINNSTYRRLDVYIIINDLLYFSVK